MAATGKGRRAALGGGALTLAVAIAVWVTAAGDEAPPAPRAEADEFEDTARSQPAARAFELPPAAAPADEQDPLPPIIDEIIVEKQEVCEGEENLITVKAHTPAGRDDAFLHYFVGASAGRAVPLRSYILSDEAKAAGLGPRVNVFGRNNVMTTVPVPTFKVKPCRPDRTLDITWRQPPNALDELELTATVREHGGSPPLQPRVWRWSFGDRGPEETTALPVVVHSFPPRDPDALHSQYLVRCEAVGSDGRTVVGRAALEVRNPEFDDLHYKKTLVMSAALSPRFPEMDANGTVTQRVRLFHYRSAPVKVHQARINYVMAEGTAAPPEEVRPAAEVLGTTEVPPGRGVETTVRFEARSRRDALMVSYLIDGAMADGTPAVASFSIMRPPPEPTPENGERISDPLLTQKILVARERLGKPFVTDEDLRRLELEGAFADLRVDPNPVVPAGGDAPSPELKAALASKARGR